MGHWKNRWIQTPQRILMDPCIKQAPVLSKWFWIIPWPLAYNRLELDCIRKIINFWYTFGWKWRVFVTIYDCRTHVRMTSTASSVERTDLNFKISVALVGVYAPSDRMSTAQFVLDSRLVYNIMLPAIWFQHPSLLLILGWCIILCSQRYDFNSSVCSWF